MNCVTWIRLHSRAKADSIIITLCKLTMFSCQCRLSSWRIIIRISGQDYSGMEEKFRQSGDVLVVMVIIRHCNTYIYSM